MDIQNIDIYSHQEAIALQTTVQLVCSYLTVQFVHIKYEPETIESYQQLLIFIFKKSCQQ